MIRVARRTRLKPGCEEEYKKRHNDVWPEVLELIKDSGIHNYSIYISGLDLFSYLEVDNWDYAIEHMLKEEVGERFQKYMAPLMDSENPESPWKIIDEVFHLK